MLSELASAWSDVAVVFIAAVPATISAVAALRVHSQVKPSNGRKLADITEETNALATEANSLAQQVASGDIQPPHGARDAISPGSPPEPVEGRT